MKFEEDCQFLVSQANDIPLFIETSINSRGYVVTLTQRYYHEGKLCIHPFMIYDTGCQTLPEAIDVAVRMEHGQVKPPDTGKFHSIWVEGGKNIEGVFKAHGLGYGYGETFQDACDWFFMFNSGYNRERLEINGLLLHNNEADARKSFG